MWEFSWYQGDTSSFVKRGTFNLSCLAGSVGEIEFHTDGFNRIVSRDFAADSHWRIDESGTKVTIDWGRYGEHSNDLSGLPLLKLLLGSYVLVVDVDNRSMNGHKAARPDHGRKAVFLRSLTLDALGSVSLHDHDYNHDHAHDRASQHKPRSSFFEVIKNIITVPVSNQRRDLEFNENPELNLFNVDIGLGRCFPLLNRDHEARQIFDTFARQERTRQEALANYESNHLAWESLKRTIHFPVCFGLSGLGKTTIARRAVDHVLGLKGHSKPLDPALYDKVQDPLKVLNIRIGKCVSLHFFCV